jgi:uridine kinase
MTDLDGHRGGGSHGTAHGGRANRAPITVGWEEAAERLLAAAAEIRCRRTRVFDPASEDPPGSRHSIVIGVTGPVGSGKSLLASRLSACVVSTDDYLPDYDRVEPDQRDLPEHADLDQLAADLSSLRAGLPTPIPIWSFQSHRREGRRSVVPTDVIVCEGLHAVHARVRARLDLAVFVDSPRSVRWSRWEAIERAGLRGWGVEKAREHFDLVAEPTFSRFEREYRAAADVIVMNA